jgi:hypothetical protein
MGDWIGVPGVMAAHHNLDGWMVSEGWIFGEGIRSLSGKSAEKIL